MLKKFVSILMLYSALALMLGHNFIGHRHHDFEHNEVSHHHHDGHHHHNDSDSEEENDGWTNLFSGIQHGAEGLTFLTSHGSDNLTKQIPQFNALHISNFIFQRVIVEGRQNAPPYVSNYYNSQNFLPSGLRAPPFFIV